MNLDRYCVRESYTIKEVLEHFESNQDRVAIVISKTNKAIGVVSQGDILRALSAGRGIFTPICQIIQGSFLHLYDKDMQKAYLIFKKTKITLLPIINQSNELVDVITLTDIYNYLETQKNNGKVGST